MTIEFCVIVVSVIGIILLVTRLFLQDELTTVTTTANVLPALRTLDRRVRVVNSQADRIAERQKGYHRFSPLLRDLGNALPPSTKMTRITIDAQTKKITLQGQAKERQNLLDLEKNVTAIKELQNVVIPFTNLLTKENPTWTLHATLTQ